MRNLLLSISIMTMFFGCGDDEVGADDAMVKITEQAVHGEYANVWSAIHPFQQPVIDEAAFSSCLRSTPLSDANVEVTDSFDSDVLVTDERFDVTGVTLAIESEDAEPWQGTFMLTKIDGTWRWVWPDDWIRLLDAGECPRIWSSE